MILSAKVEDISCTIRSLYGPDIDVFRDDYDLEMLLHQPSGQHPLALKIWNTAQLMGELFDRHLNAAGGNRYWFFLLDALAQHPDASQGELAQAVGVDATTMTHHLRVMERQGLIQRNRSMSDRRVYQTTVLPQGVDLRDALLGEVREYNTAQFAGMTRDEIDLLTTLVFAVENNARHLLAISAP